MLICGKVSKFTGREPATRATAIRADPQPPATDRDQESPVRSIATLDPWTSEPSDVDLIRNEVRNEPIKEARVTRQPSLIPRIVGTS